MPPVEPIVAAPGTALQAGNEPLAGRREAISRSIANRTGISDPMIALLVNQFYAKVRDDNTLGPVFAVRIADWPSHLRRMCSFWSSVALMTGRYHGRPMEKHADLPIDARHFDRWLTLFEETARETCPPAAADHFIERARKIAESLELGVAIHCGSRLGMNERLRRPNAEILLPDSPPALTAERPPAGPERGNVTTQQRPSTSPAHRAGATATPGFSWAVGLLMVALGAGSALAWWLLASIPDFAPLPRLLP